MLITNTITKKLLETIVYQSFLKFGSISSSCLLDSLKFLGFSYATTAGISIAIEDLKTPNSKKDFLNLASQETDFISSQWNQGLVSDNERFQSIIDSWNVATESLKNRIVEYYQSFDPANNLYIMAFSGARGNMSQVRQLVGMRGLMSDQDGKIIDLPIKTNFREGLSSIDYIISSYGARKGIVDTALKTADSGYLTRRLIYISQDLVIREFDCQTKKGVIIFVTKNTNMKNLIGRNILCIRKENKILDYFSNIFLDTRNIQTLKTISPVLLNIRTPLTCKSNGSICQKCYGWDLAQNKIISLGEAVGILAAQSIGEPGTQLTMRTFHTGGIFTSEILKPILSPFSGKLFVPDSLKMVSYRNNHGIFVSKLQQEAILSLVNWKGIKKDIFLEIGSFLYISSSQFVKKSQIISESATKSILSGSRKLKPIYSFLSGEIKFESLVIRSIFRIDKSTVKVNQDNGTLWLAAGTIFRFPKESLFNFQLKLNKKKALGSLKIVSPFEGILIIEQKILYLLTNEKKLKLDFSWLTKNLKDFTVNFSNLVKNFQFIDKYTIIGELYLYPKIEEKLYNIKRKESKYFFTFLFIMESNICSLNIDQVNHFINFSKNRSAIRSGKNISENSKIGNSGFFLKKDGLKMVFQKAIPIFVSHGTILNCKKGDFVLEKQILATLVNYTQQNEDIVQGLPKIEELIEARIPKNKCYLSIKPGVLLNSFYSHNFNSIKFLDKIETLESLNYIYHRYKIEKLISKTKKEKKQIIQIIHNISLKYPIIIFDEKIWKVIPLPPGFEPQLKRTKSEYYFKNSENQILLINGKLISSTWVQRDLKSKELFHFKVGKSKKQIWKKRNVIEPIYENKKGDYILKTEDNYYFFLELINPIHDYKLPLSAKLLFKPGNFVDLGEPITEGLIDPHELLLVFFKYHCLIDGIFLGTLRSLNKFQLLVVNSIQAIYQSQGVNISSKHIEIIVRQMTSKVVIKDSGDTPLLPGELIRFSLMYEICKLLKLNQEFKKYKTPQYEPLFLSTTNSSLSKDGFLSAAGFQETKRVLTKATIEGTSDWLRGLKECVIIGRLIPAGSAFLNYKNYLDNIYLYKD